MAAYSGQFITPGRFAGKVAVVTGAAQGIGQKVAERIGAEGGSVVLVDRADIVKEVAKGIQDAALESGSGGSAISVTGDLESFAGAERAVNAALARHGRIDVLVNNVGGTIWARPYEEYDEEQIEREIRRSLFPTLWSCRAVLPAMLAKGSGTIVNVSSVATRGVHRVPYAAAKGGVNALTQSLAMEVAGRGIRVVATAPGGTEAPPRRVKRGPEAESTTEKAWYQAIVDQTVESSFLKRYGTLEEQAAPIVFLASDEASYVTGSVLPVAGGDLG
ncbi:1,6-dihydroxycyclohexa-2,4-diene-1-carboxylate dehydrogenase [Arthrobacter sp. YN]|uniref:1,6-dihydroxycyclohexa-2,4-diene-1-carboxylate dehydrogenase n=1 Tax=Arthrobacter sp. YN TaxID=2020486 RepID=UPI000B5F2F28|nr:1,6-dihydroxycyclohexa-2,4-diene-1-carboxylate dehydrogenase [Arthrobacter sp. YN]ASN20057.1 1,6-dihydroxycyclohexa-2,4-diene-1-carboxylate dehydrogenase [Arthrobacter sp. YN]